LEKAEEEQESYRRRIKLLEVELEKTKKTLTEKEDRLSHLEGASFSFLFAALNRDLGPVVSKPFSLNGG
jgi:hypothetical protein